jgi:RimJ/RimL family protein N-acetyltransferase
MIDKQLERYDQKRYGLQMISNRIDNKPIGLCGLLLQQVDDVVELEVGYHFLYQHWGFGYATEAASIMIEYARKNKLADSLISVIDLLNYKSQAVAERNCFVREKELLYFGDEVYIYRKSLL